MENFNPNNTIAEKQVMEEFGVSEEDLSDFAEVEFE